MPYAASTTTTKQASLDELERILTKYSCTSFIAGTHEGQATIGFQVAGLNILMRIPLPNINENRFTHTPTRGARNPKTVHAAHQTAVRATWRALVLFVKAKLVGVDQGLTTIEQEFMPHVLLADGTTLFDTAIPAIRASYARGEVPALIPSPGRPALEAGPR